VPTRTSTKASFRRAYLPQALPSPLPQGVPSRLAPPFPLQAFPLFPLRIFSKPLTIVWGASPLKGCELRNLELLRARTSSIKVRRAEEGSDVVIEFVYKATKITVGELYTRNQLIIESRSGDGLGSVRLKSWGARHWSHEAGTLARLITMRWSTTRRTLA